MDDGFASWQKKMLIMMYLDKFLMHYMRLIEIYIRN